MTSSNEEFVAVDQDITESILMGEHSYTCETKSVSMPINGVVIGILIGLRDDGTPLVAFPGNPRPECLEARTTVVLSREDIGHQIALLFEGGDPSRPLLIGRIQNPGARPGKSVMRTGVADLDEQRLVLIADREIVLRCGEASITLTRAGKVLIKGTYVLTRSSGANKIKGAAVDIN